MVHGKNRIPYWIDRRLTGLAGRDYAATISFGLPFEPGDSQYGEYRLKCGPGRAPRRVRLGWRSVWAGVELSYGFGGSWGLFPQSIPR